MQCCTVSVPGCVWPKQCLTHTSRACLQYVARSLFDDWAILKKQSTIEYSVRVSAMIMTREIHGLHIHGDRE